jgi:hypothetical protein
MRSIALIMFLSSIAVLAAAFLPVKPLDNSAHLSAARSVSFQRKGSTL